MKTSHYQRERERERERERQREREREREEKGQYQDPVVGGGWPVGRRGEGWGGWGARRGKVKEPASQCARICQHNPFSKLPFSSFSQILSFFWGVAKGSSTSWVATFKGDKTSECKLSNGWSQSCREVELFFFLRENEGSRSYRVTYQHRSLPSMELYDPWISERPLCFLNFGPSQKSGTKKQPKEEVLGRGRTP